MRCRECVNKTWSYAKTGIDIVWRCDVDDQLINLNDECRHEYDCPIHGKLGGIDECPKC